MTPAATNRIQNVEAPLWQGAPSAVYREYMIEAQRRQSGWIRVLKLCVAAGVMS